MIPYFGDFARFAICQLCGMRGIDDNHPLECDPRRALDVTLTFSALDQISALSREAVAGRSHRIEREMIDNLRTEREEPR